VGENAPPDISFCLAISERCLPDTRSGEDEVGGVGATNFTALFIIEAELVGTTTATHLINHRRLRRLKEDAP